MGKLGLEELLARAESMGITIHWDADSERQAYWVQAMDAIVLRDAMTQRRTKSLLAHELGHAHYGDWCSAPKAEKRAWRYAANLLIDPDAFDDAVHVYGPHMGAIARQLDVLVDVVRAHWERNC